MADSVSLTRARVLVQQQMSDAQELLAHEDYVHRTLFLEGTDPEKARVRRLWREELGASGSGCFDEDELKDLERVVVLGNAGAGKSFVLAHRYVVAAERYLEDPSTPVPLWLDLPSDLGTDLNVEDALSALAGPAWMDRADEATQFALYIDTLDEILAGQARPRAFVNDLEIFINTNHPHLQHVAVACRRHAWTTDYLSRCEPNFKVISADSIGSDEYAQIISDDDRLREFYERCHALGVGGLLDNAFDGFYLAQRFRAGDDLPSTRLQLLEERTTGALQAARPQDSAQSPGTQRLRQLADQLACIATFTENADWAKSTVRDVLTAAAAQADSAPVTREEVDWLLCQPLFRRHGDQFIFTHELFCEYLAATALSGLPLRKQRQLLEAGAEAGRVAVVLRPVASMLAGLSQCWRDWLTASDPVAAFLAEATHLDDVEDEHLTRRVIERAVEREEAPWFGLPPHGETLRDHLPRYQPQDVAAFTAIYLEDEREIARIWGTACAAAWGGDAQLNDRLRELARDPDQDTEIRRNAVAAIAATDDGPSIQALFDLLEDDDDRVRGLVLQVYRETTAPSPDDFIGKLLGGATDDSMLCLLQMEAQQFAGELDEHELQEALRCVEEYFDELDNLRAYLLQGLVRRAKELGYTEIPPSLVVRAWAEAAIDTRRGRHEDGLMELIAQSPSLFDAVWSYSLEATDDDAKIVYRAKVRERLGELADDRIFELPPADSERLSRRQYLFVEGALRAHFGKRATRERLNEFQSKAHEFTEHWRLDRPESPREHVPLEEKRQLLETMALAEDNQVGRAHNALLVISEIEAIDVGQLTVEVVDRVLSRLGPVVRRLVEKAFDASVEQIDYNRRIRPHFEFPFVYLRAQGVEFSAQKMSQIACSYGFRYGNDPQYISLLEEIRELSDDIWRDTIFEIFEDPLSSPDGLMEYLVTLNAPFYLDRCGERLRNGWLHSSHLQPLLDYWHHFRPEDYAQALRYCYQVLDEHLMRDGTEATYLPEDAVDTTVLPDLDRFRYWWKFTPLLMLMQANDDWAWDEFRRLLQVGDVPLTERLVWSWKRLPEWQRLPDQADTIADWYALVCRRWAEDDLGCRSLKNWLMESLKQIGGLQGAAAQLDRLRRDNAFDGAQWLSSEIIQIEDQLLWPPRANWQLNELLLFILKATYRVIHTEADLWECVCDAIEELQRELSCGDGVNGFWDGNGPKIETGCQNVLWPRLRDKLANWGVVGVEERLVGRNPSDFWVELPRRDQSNLRTIIELKTARQGYGGAELVDSMEEQLCERYMEPEGCSHGIHVVLWFKCADYPYPVRWDTPDELLADLQEKAGRMSDECDVEVVPCVLDVTAQPRR